MIISIFGFVESFSANYFCRFCTSIKSVTQKQTEEKNADMRCQSMYDIHLKNNDFGIKDSCVFNDLKYFHCYINQSADIMHDLFEGIHRYDMCIFIDYFIKNQYFCLETLNSRVKFFNYRYQEKNIPPAVAKKHLIITNLNRN